MLSIKSSKTMEGLYGKGRTEEGDLLGWGH
jgi:hypothetical protein